MLRHWHGVCSSRNPGALLENAVAIFYTTDLQLSVILSPIIWSRPLSSAQGTKVSRFEPAGPNREYELASVQIWFEYKPPLSFQGCVWETAITADDLCSSRLCHSWVDETHRSSCERTHFGGDKPNCLELFPRSLGSNEWEAIGSSFDVLTGL